MKTKRNSKDTGSALLCVFGAILILSLIGATVLQNATTRLNASCNQVRAWKESLLAAESGGDIAFAEIRTHKLGSNPATWWVGWTQSGTKYTSPITTFGSSNLQAQAVVEECYFHPTTKLLTLGHPATGNSWYRLRSKGTAPLPNLKRTGMDDALIADGVKHFAAFGSTEMQDITARGKGDSLLRKIDFNTDHFIATYGPDGDGVNKAIVPLSTSPNPSISRRIEQLVSPVTPFFDAAIKSAGLFYGLGSASYIDSYNSNNGPYDPTVKNNPSSPYYGDSRHGNVEIDSAVATVKGDIYGDLSTNGGKIVSGSPGVIYGTIDNNVPFVLEDFQPNTSGWVYQPVGSNPGQLPASISSTTTLNMQSAGTKLAPVNYLVSSITGNLTVNPAVDPVSGNQLDTFVAVHVTGDISGGSAGITVNPKVKLKIYFNGNLDTKAVNLVNNSPSAANPYAGNLQFYGISPTLPSTTQTVTLTSGGGQTLLAATCYAPSANVEFQGSPDFIGTVVCKSFYANGNITWHYDRALNDEGELQDYRIASYIEDPR